MTHAFYLFGIIFILYELTVLAAPRKMAKLVMDGRADLKKSKEERDKDITMKMGMLGLIAIPYMIWIIIGLLVSSQTMIFLTLLIVSFLTMLLKKLSKKLEGHTQIQTLDAIFSILIVSYAIYNHFHHIDLI